MAEGTIDNVNGLLLSAIYSSYSKKITVPTDFESRTALLQVMNEDPTGLVKSLGNLAVESAAVEYNIVSENKNYNYILKKWLYEIINADYNGLVPRGINALQEEYVRERILGASFPVLKIAEWKEVDGVQLPSRMFFVDGGSIRAKKKGNDSGLTLSSYDYYLGSDDNAERLKNNIIMQKCYARWHAKYPNIFMFDRGIYRNFYLIKLLKEKQGEILSEIIPLITLIMKSTEALMKSQLSGEGGKIYNPTEQKAIKDQVEKQVQDKKDNPLLTSLLRVTNADEDWKHIIPDITPLFKPEISSLAEKGILAGYGFVELTSILHSNRKESALNPIAFVREIKSCVQDFREKFLKELFYRVQEKNKDLHRKFANVTAEVTNTQVKDFIDSDFKILAKSLWDKGLLSDTTMLSLGIDANIKVESDLRKTENEDGITKLLKPRPAQYQDLAANTLVKPNKPTEDIKGKPIDQDKLDNNALDYKIAEDEFEMIEISAPYKMIKDLPTAVKKIPAKYRKMWLEIFNNCYYYKIGKGATKEQADRYSFAGAWKKVKEMMKKKEKNT